MNKPKRLGDFMYAIMKEARRNSLMELLETWEISEEDYDEISDWFRRELDIKL